MDPPPDPDPAAFYDDLAASYSRLYPDWESACRRQGAVLDRLISDRLGPGPRLILDAAVGIGTQLLGLIPHGHVVVGTDVSLGAVSQARLECDRRAVAAPLAVADIRALPFGNKIFDAVVCADNAVAHLMSPERVITALEELRRVTRSAGVVVVTVRDYEEARQTHPPGTLPQVWTGADETTVSFQVWDWREDGERYDVQHFQLVDAENRWQVARRATSLWALTGAELVAFAEAAGLQDPVWLRPEESGFFQPLLMAGVS